MKKIILTFVTVFSLIACEKPTSDATSESSESAIINADSASTSNAVKFDSVQKPLEYGHETTSSSIKDTAVVKIEDLKEQKQLLTEKVAKEIDSATRSTIISEIKITQQKIDSVKGKIVSVSKKQTITPRVARETKVIYRDVPKPKVITRVQKITKKGELEIQVDDIELAQTITKEQIRKYDGTIKSEEISSYQNRQFDYLKINVPLNKSEYLIKDLETNVGKIVSRNIEIIGEEYGKNAVCYLEITLTSHSQEAVVPVTSKSFGGRTVGAVGSGWNVIQEIFLFILPLWPLFLIGGGIYYFMKRKRAQN
ncbi:DUF4349 domain-containing protein [Chryseobacterium sp. SNU WT5]|uniref:DUF4349 domain-containing protein n=1 Tax=Chryseobacterium sp. SNU WT5 TaxID=2594269 RepID=UPI00117BEFA4|nr:DUF4349 domain-containing protein [Chryseobacterium sp. SNU WT5]QDP85143.1 DUF4349 domain-containing protein [Chryseobacterium sp. SNU WT5]